MSTMVLERSPIEQIKREIIGFIYDGKNDLEHSLRQRFNDVRVTGGRGGMFNIEVDGSILSALYKTNPDSVTITGTEQPY